MNLRSLAGIMPARYVHILLARRRQPGRIFLVLAGGPLAFMGLLGADDGGGAYLFALALICLLQAVYPTLLGWALVASIYSIFSVIYFFAIIRDIVALARGHEASILLNPIDSVVFVALLLVLLAIGVAVVFHRPKPFSA